MKTENIAPQWIKAVQRKHPPLFMSFLIEGQHQRYIKEFTGLDFEFRNVKKIGLDLLFDKNETGRLQGIMERKLDQEGVDFFDSYANRCYQQANRFLEVSEDLAKTRDIYSMNAAQLAESFSRYADEAVKMASFLLTLLVSQTVLEGRLLGLIEQKISHLSLAKKAPEYKQLLAVPARETPEVENMWDIVLLCSRVQEDQSLLEIFSGPPEQAKESIRSYPWLADEITSYIRKYDWIKPMYYRGDEMSTEDVIARLKNALQTNCSERLNSKAKKKLEEEQALEQAVSELQLSSSEKHLVSVIREYLHLRTYRLEVFFMANSKVKPILNSIAKSLGISYDDLLFMTHPEILSSLRDRSLLNEHTIWSRKSGFAVVMLDNEVAWYDGSSLEELLALEQKALETASSVKGITASPGRVKARARVVLSNDEVEKVQNGEILVTTMTTPSLMLAIERASGIITNEGGMLCHAAIVSRELGIPCIIGTDKATEVFSDGDLVDLDANNGIARKVEE